MKLHELKDVFTEKTAQESQVVPEPVRVTRAGRGYVQAAVMDYMMARKGELLRVADIADGVGFTPKQVGDMLYKAAAAGSVRKVKDWQLNEYKYAFEGDRPNAIYAHTGRGGKSPTVGQMYELRVKTVYLLRLPDGKEIEITKEQWMALTERDVGDSNWESDDA